MIRPRDKLPSRPFAPNGSGAAHDGTGEARRSRQLLVSRASFVAAFLAVVFAVVATVVAHAGGPSPSASRHGRTAQSAPRPRPSVPPATTSSTTSTSTSTTSTLTSGPGPHLLALLPATGTAGEIVTIEGSGLFSLDGSIVATFDGRVTTTRCSSEERCIATVPARPPGTSLVEVKLQTSNGDSNALMFRYR